MRGLMRGLLILLLLACAATPAAAQRLALRNGQYRWFEAPVMLRTGGIAGGVSIAVSIPEQRAYVYLGGRLIGVTTVSTGMRGHSTPPGEYTILQKQVFHRSNLYSNAPMPYMQRLTWTGIALHAGHLPGYPASHGCIRMPRAFARTLYDLTEIGAAVTVVNHRIDAAPPAAFPPPVQVAQRTPRRWENAVASAPLPSIPYPQPILVADTRALNGAAFDVLTMAGDPPVGTAEWVTDDDPAMR